ncbi:hypothetical protein JCM21900_006870 [Sporobolomyces salmonicolor]
MAAPAPADTSSVEDKLAGFDAVPLFMRSLPSELGGTADTKKTTPGETNPNDTLAALQALAYEGDPSEIAEGFREQGNDLFKRRKFRDAMGFYTRALDEVGKDLSIEERRTLWSNRAACNLELSNFGACLRDCSLVLGQTNPNYPDRPSASSNKTTMKALLRSARALSGLEKLPEALDALHRLKVLEEEIGEKEADVGKRWRDEVEKKMEVKTRKEKEKNEKERRAKEGEKAIMDALRLRGVIFPKPTTKVPLFHHCPTDVTPPHFDPDSLPRLSSPSIPLLPPPAPTNPPYAPWVAPPPTTPLTFPVFLLLPLASPPTRDLCLAFHEQATFGDALLSMEHDPVSTQLYLATKQGKVLKIGAKLTLGKVLEAAGRPREGEMERDGWELKEGWALEMVGVPKGKEGEDWIQEWKKEVQEGKKAIL